MIWLCATLALAALVLCGAPRLLNRRPRRDPAEVSSVDGPAADYQEEIGDELDLHGVPDAEVDALVDAFVELAGLRGWTEIKIIHGKGTGRRRARVRARLAQHPHVVRCGDAASPGSGWGATVVLLRPPRSAVAPPPPAD